MDGPSLQTQWLIHALVVALTAYPMIRIFRRAGLSPWPVLFLVIPVFGFAVVGSILAFTRWPKIAPRRPEKR
jgi:hypothetical protein